MRMMQSIGFVLASGLAMGLGCQFIAGVDGTADYVPGAGGAGGATGSGSMMSSSSSTGIGGTGGTGGAPHECNVVGDCASTECKTATGCIEGLCVWMYKATNEETVSQLYGDCKMRLCDGNGGVTTVDNPDSKDTYDWANPCYVNSCAAFPVPIALPDNGQKKVCTTPWNGAGYCSNFKCIQCIMDADCVSSFCRNDRCVVPTCANSMLDPGETDIDCGGSSNCLPCDADKACMVNSDCVGTCDMNTMKCLAPTCSDGTRNGDETDLDCGGLCAKKDIPPKKCLTDQKCHYPEDCQSGVCKSGVCQEASCSDYIQNQGEEGIDCGGPCVLACPKP